MGRFSVVVAGYGEVACEGTKALLEAGLDVTGAFTYTVTQGEWQRDFGRFCKELGIRVWRDVDAKTEMEKIARRLDADLLVSLYYRDVIPERVLECFRRGGVNLHGSALPKYRGRAPVNWMVLKGESVGGVTLHIMTKRVDAGPILGQIKFEIAREETAFDVLLKVIEYGRRLISQCVVKYLEGKLEVRAQEGDASKFPRRRPEDGKIEWTWERQKVLNLIRAVTRPYPGAFTYVGDRKLYIWWAEEAQAGVDVEAGGLKVDGGSIYAGCADGVLRLVDFCFEGLDFESSVDRLVRIGGCRLA